MSVTGFAQGTLDWNTLSLCVSLLVALVLAVKLRDFVKTYLLFHNFPGSYDRSYLCGHLRKVLVDGETFIKFGRQRMEEGNGKYTCLWLSPLRPDILVFHPELVKKILMSSAPKCRHLGGAYSLLLPWIGEGLIAANGQRWARSRKLLTPAFHFDILKDYMCIYNEAADRLIAILDVFAETGKSFDICHLVALCTLEVILKCSMGFKADILGKCHPYARAAKELTESLFERAKKPWLWPDVFFRMSDTGKTFYKHCNYVHGIAEEIIERRKHELENGNGVRGRHMDFIDILLSARDETGQAMTTTEIRNEVDTFLFAGHDTTSTAVPWVLYTLAKHTEYQNRIQEEVDSLVEGRDKPCILWQDLSKLETLSLCNKETMRLYPPVPFIQRALDADTDFDGRIISAGTIVTIAIVHLHRNPHIWDEPDEFRPERFQVQNKNSMDNFSFIPFSAGARNCIGQNFALNEEKVLLARILQRYDVRLAPDAQVPKRMPAGVLKSDGGIWLTLQKR